MPTPTLAPGPEVLVVEGPLEEERGRDQDDHDPDPRGPAGSDALLEAERPAASAAPGSTWESLARRTSGAERPRNGGARSTEAVTTSGGGAATGGGAAASGASRMRGLLEGPDPVEQQAHLGLERGHARRPRPRERALARAAR